MKWTLINFDEDWDRTIVPSQVRESRGLNNPRLGVGYAYRVLMETDDLPMDVVGVSDDYEFVVSDDGERPIEFVDAEFRHTVNSATDQYAEFKALDVTSLELVMSAATKD